jgi:hypothetical protein
MKRVAVQHFLIPRTCRDSRRMRGSTIQIITPEDIRRSGASSLAIEARLVWPYRHWQLSVVGQHPWENQQAACGARAMRRRVYGKVTWRF